VASFEVNSEPQTGARPSVRLCVGPELARCVHSKLRAPPRRTSLGPFVCGARACSLCSLAFFFFLKLNLQHLI
jgi:hypothetical protein